MQSVAKHRVLVCVHTHTKSSTLLRTAIAEARKLDAEVSVLSITLPEKFRNDYDATERLSRTLQLAERMGAEVYQIPDKTVIGGIKKFLKEVENTQSSYTHIFIGQSELSKPFANIKVSLSERILRSLNDRYVVQVIPLLGTVKKNRLSNRYFFSKIRLDGIVFALLSVLVALGLSELIHSSVSDVEWRLNTHNMTSIFFVACMITSLKFGLFSGLFSILISFLFVNFFYIEPVREFAWAATQNSISTLLFLTSAIVVSFVGAYSRANTSALRIKEKRVQAFYRIYRLATQAKDQATAIKVLHNEIYDLLQTDIVFCLPNPSFKKEVIQQYPRKFDMGENELNALGFAWKELRSTGWGTVNSFGSHWRFEPITTPYSEIGILGVRIPKDMNLDTSFTRVLNTLVDQTANILERIEITKLIGESKIREEREKLRSMLLSSVSHDLKTPLASIIGSLSVYQSLRNSKRLTPQQARELTDTAFDEAQRLDSFITNILDMTRIESGDIQFDIDWHDPNELLGRVVKRLRQRIKARKIVIQFTQEKCEVRMDSSMTEQVLQNLIDNAAKYSSSDTEIHVKANMKKDKFVFEIKDFGSGIPKEKLESIFDKYERLKQSDSQVAGTGLGLAICRSIMEKQGGTVIASNHDNGAIFTVTFPKARPIKGL